MIKASLAAFLSSYFSVFYAPRIDLFWCSFLPIIIYLILIHKQTLRTIYVALFFFIWTQGAIQWQLESRYNLPEKATVVLDLEVTQLPQVKANSISFIAKPIKIHQTDSKFDFLKLKAIKINWYRTNQPLKGAQIWRMKLRLQAPHGYQNEGGFDYERWMFSEKISATAYVLNNFEPKLLRTSSNTLLKVRSWLSEKILIAAAGFENRALFQTLSIGDKSLLNPDIKQLFIETGTAHLLVISGLHVGLLSLLFYFLAARLWLVFNQHIKSGLNQGDFAVIWAWSAAFIYSALAGFSLPTLRALIMLSVFYAALIRRQNNQFLNALSSALVLVLFIEPLALLSYSFWLSFLAILIIVVSTYGLAQYPKWKSIVALQLIFSFLFIPLNAVIFNQFIGVSFFANLLLIPIMSFIVIPLNLMSTFLSSLDWSISIYIYQFLDGLLSYLIAYLQFLKGSVGGTVYLSDKNVWLMLISIFGALNLFLLPKRNSWLILIVIIVLPWFYWPKALEKKDFSLTFFDVGMGTSVFIKTKNYSLLYDLGPGNNSSYQPAKWVLEPYLKGKGIKFINMVVMSHSDQDHYGGIWALKDKDLMSNSRFFTGTLNQMKNIVPNVVLEDCHKTKPWVWDGITFKFLPLINNRLTSDNNLSCVLAISSPHGKALLTGDVEKEREIELMEHYKKDLKADVMLVPHHGSRTSSSIGFLQAIKARYAIVTTGYLNHWGFPKEDVMGQYDRLGINWLNTGSDGEIFIEFKKDDIQVMSLRKKNKALWY